MSWSVPFDLLTKKKTDLLMVLHIMQESPRCGKLQPYNPFLGTRLKDTGEVKSSHWAELPAVHMVTVCMEGEMTRHTTGH